MDAYTLTFNSFIERIRLFKHLKQIRVIDIFILQQLNFHVRVLDFILCLQNF